MKELDIARLVNISLAILKNGIETETIVHEFEFEGKIYTFSVTLKEKP